MKRTPARYHNLVQRLLPPCPFLAASFALLLLAGCAGSQARREGMIFLGDWYDYYWRGLAREDTGQYAEAAEDIREALKSVPRENPHKRTYGVRRIPYYAHRELGICLLALGDPDGAIVELETSLSQAPTGKAKYYLNQARRAVLEQRGTDEQPPSIEMTSPSPDIQTPGFRVRVAGVARDDQYVAGIRVNGRKLFVELAEPEVAFELEIELQEGSNQVDVEAVDLVGKVSRATRRISADHAGPLLSIDEKSGPDADRRVRVAGFVHDDGGIAEFLLGGQPVAVPEAQAAHQDFEIVRQLPAGEDSLPFRITDTAGNLSEGIIEFGQETGSFGWSFRGRRIRVASVGWNPEYLLAAADTEPPRVRMKKLSQQQKVFLDQIYIDGFAGDDDMLVDLRLSQTSPEGPIIDRKSLLPREARTVYFNHLVDLNTPGDNVIAMEAEDRAGNVSSATALLEREEVKARSIGERLRLSVFPLVKEGERGDISDLAYDYLLDAFLESGRFQILEREAINAVLDELELGASELADPDRAVKAGRMLAADLLLLGSVREKGNSIHITARIVDVETGRVVSTDDVYHEEKTLERLAYLAEGLYLKVAQRFPLLEGEVVNKDRALFYVDRGSRDLLWPGMKVVLFRETGDLVTPSGLFLGKKIEEVGEGLLRRIEEDFSAGAPYQREDLDKIQVNDRMITR
jgi:TolB-like protein